LMEALQMLKFMLKKQQLNFTDTWETPAAEMQDDHKDMGMLEDILGAQDMELDKVLETLDEEE
ncbi:hypothetical protein BS47DRAFT_1348082, partial [Hydnum rufescens UP504]